MRPEGRVTPGSSDATLQTFPLGREDVHLWTIAPTQEVHDRLWDVLSDDERERALRYRSDAARCNFVCVRSLLRHVLSRYTPVDPGCWRFGAERAGRPCVIAPMGTPVPRFSVSHTGGLGLVGVARTSIGVDLEALSRTLSSQVGTFMLSAYEAAALPHEPKARQQALLGLWTLKEAYGKALGIGLHASLRKTLFTLAADTPALRNPCGLRWTFRHLALGNQYLCAIALRLRAGSTPQLQVFNCEEHDLLRARAAAEAALSGAG